MRWRRFARLRIAPQLDAQRCASSIPRFGGLPAPAFLLIGPDDGVVRFGNGELTAGQLVNHRERGVPQHGMTSRRELVAAKNAAREKHIEALTERLAILMETLKGLPTPSLRSRNGYVLCRESRRRSATPRQVSFNPKALNAEPISSELRL